MADEQSPLLGDHPHGNGSLSTPSDADPSSVPTNVLPADEASNAKLALILGSVWVGVFFAAVGTGLPTSVITARRTYRL